MAQSSGYSLYQEAKAGAISLLKQTALVCLVFIIMLLVTGGNPPEDVVGITFCLTVVLVAWAEGKRKNSAVTQKQLALLRKNVDVWNTWRFRNSSVEINLSGVNLHGADLRGADLRGANLRRADFRGADLSEANLSKSDLSKANFAEAVLFKTNFNEANLYKVNFSEADLYKAALDKAKVQKALFSNNVGLTDKEKAALKERGAFFQDSPGSQVSV
jgi:hypothetical protein